jgi:hypothetical protein
MLRFYPRPRGEDLAPHRVEVERQVATCDVLRRFAAACVALAAACVARFGAPSPAATCGDLLQCVRRTCGVQRYVASVWIRKSVDNRVI